MLTMKSFLQQTEVVISILGSELHNALLRLRDGAIEEVGLIICLSEELFGHDFKLLASKKNF